MSRSIHVALTLNNITDGKPRGALSCPIAVNLAETLGVQPTIYRDWAYLFGNDLDGEYNLPPEAQAFIDDFDAGRPVEPIEFDMTEVSYDDKQVDQ